ncbi:F-box/LRR-repeat protein 6 [Cimex lectularius]|uniref:F-box domain-containing protein n=1 Tax=Cimex lectularius TaxID=79782 RepID=A0A8I6RQ24_CIMLE|nr:F-box/LRR-repeat protein 6 [Cimex lectularius]XP_014249065.1 F-box/LRR-repeat protein 6 [Cimex lectularius]XP_014249066.1 F-box/LRR-repeat protein 6 [Cimex lectularius]
MDERNGDCFENHEDLFAPLSVSDSEHDCLKDFLLEPPEVQPPVLPPQQVLPLPTPSLQQDLHWNNGQVFPACSVDIERCLLPVNNNYTPELDQVPVANGDCWSPIAFTASASERTVSSDCVSSETMCSPSEGTSDSPSPYKACTSVEEPQKKRGRKRKAGSSRGRFCTTVTTYQSQISPDQNGIKIRIKKSLTEVPQKVKKKKVKVVVEDDYVEPTEQSPWGDKIPHFILHNIFKMVTKIEGCVPFLVRVSRVCRLWREVAISPRLWQHVDLASFWVKDRAKNDLKFRWLCENRLALVHDLNIGGWEFDGIPSILDKMASSCGELRGISLAGWQGLSIDHVKFLIAHCPKLQRLDLSAINLEMGNPKSAVSMLSLVNLAQEMSGRLTQLILSDNKLSGIPQIISALSTNCPNLQVLDLSNVRTVSHTTVQLHIEKLQQGCPKLRVLRITNSQVILSSVSLKEQSLSEGFPLLEELSVAGVVENMSTKPVIDDDGLLRILKSSHKLRLLDVRGCTRVSDSSIVRVPAWDLEHLFLSGCNVTRVNDSGLELICQKWAHSLVEVDLGWSTATEPLDAAVSALAEHAEKSPLRVLNLCGSSVTVEPVRAVLTRCPLLTSLNLTSCRAMPRGIKRLYEGPALNQLKETMLKEHLSSE